MLKERDSETARQRRGGSRGRPSLAVVLLPLTGAVLLCVGACGRHHVPRAAVSIEPPPRSKTTAPDSQGPLSIVVPTLALVGDHPMFVVQIRNNTAAPLRVNQWTLMSALTQSRVTDDEGRPLHWVRDTSGVMYDPADADSDFTTIRPGPFEAVQVHLLAHSDLALSERARHFGVAIVACAGTLEIADESLSRIRTIPLVYEGAVSLLQPARGEDAPVSLSRFNKGAP